MVMMGMAAEYDLHIPDIKPERFYVFLYIRDEFLVAAIYDDMTFITGKQKYRIMYRLTYIVDIIDDMKGLNLFNPLG